MINEVLRYPWRIFEDTFLILPRAQTPAPHCKKLSFITDLVIIWLQSQFPWTEFFVDLFCSATSAKAQVTPLSQCARTAMVSLCCPGIIVTVSSFHWQTRPDLGDKFCATLFQREEWRSVVSRVEERSGMSWKCVWLCDFRPCSLDCTGWQDNRFLLYHLI